MRLITKPFPAKRLVLSMLAVLGIISTATAYDFEVNGIYYNTNGTEATVTRKTTSGNSYSGNVVIPSVVTYNGITYPVTTIDDNAFSKCSDLMSIDMPESITHIGNYAFVYCTGVTNVVIPNSVITAGSSIFHGCTGLIDVTIGQSIREMSLPFSSCDNLAHVTILCDSVGDSWFMERPCLEEVVLGDKVTSIGRGAFFKCQ